LTEAYWNACTDPRPMLEWLQSTGKLSDRRARLFAVACCREVWYLLRDKRSQRAVRTSELYADGLVSNERMADVHDAARRAAAEWTDPGAIAVGRRYAAEVASAVSIVSADEAANDASDLAARVSEAEAREPGFWTRKQSQCVLLRCIVGNRFRSTPIDPSLLTAPVIDLAHRAYEERDFTRLPELANALEAAGCQDAELLGHLRSEGPHVRGCWALDLVLGKK
jgi:hypothetical protein